MAPGKKQEAIEEAIKEKRYWADHVDSYACELVHGGSVKGSVCDNSSGLPMTIVEAMSSVDADWHLFCVENGLTLDGDLELDVSLGNFVPDEKQPHRPHIVQGQPIWNAMVTEQIHPKDPRFTCPEALKARDSEVNDLRERGTWDESLVCEARLLPLKYDISNIHFARIFGILGIKNSELEESLWKWKYRAVLGGDNIRTADGAYAIFDDVGSTPSTMGAARSLMAMHAADPKLCLLQSDCIRAYIQALLPDDGPQTWVRLPKAWWPKSWIGVYSDPVVPLRRALYGHPKAGDMWHDKLCAILLSHGFEKIEGWPSTYTRRAGDQFAAIVVYVDDLLILGDASVHSLIAKMRKEVEMEDPMPVNRYLGVNHSASQTKRGAFVDTKYVFDQSSYFSSACEGFMAETGETLKLGTPSPKPPEITKAEMLCLIETPGVHGPNAAHFLMKLMYGARCACPWLLVPIQRLACVITKWNAECDRRLKRLYDYVWSNHDLVMTGSLSDEDLDTLAIHCWPDADLNGCVWHTRSTGGMFVEVSGASCLRSMPLGYGCKKHDGTALHTPEAELVTLATFTRNEFLPLQFLWQKLLGRPVELIVHEDNDACISIIRKGYSPSLRCLERTQRCSLGACHEVYSCDPPPGHGAATLIYTETKKHKGDFLTKYLDANDLNNALKMIQVVRKSSL